MSEEEDHELIPAAKVGVSLELALETGPGLTLEIGPGPAPEAGLGIVLGPTVKATLMVTYGAYSPQSPDEPLPRRRVSFHDPKDEKNSHKRRSKLLNRALC